MVAPLGALFAVQISGPPAHLLAHSLVAPLVDWLCLLVARSLVVPSIAVELCPTSLVFGSLAELVSVCFLHVEYVPMGPVVATR